MCVIRLAILVGNLILFSGGAASAIETVVAEDSCSIEGYARSLRQTIVVIDEMAVQSNVTGGTTETNRRWLNAIVTIAGLHEGQHNTIAAPREPVTVLFVKANGADVVRVFTGCPPTFSREEFDRQLSGRGGVGRKIEEWLGKDPRSRIEADKKAFRTKLLGALVQLTKENSKKATSSNFLALLPEIGRSFDIGNGIPRIVFFSPLIIPNKDYANRSAAREAGFRQAAQYAADLKRAEVYIVRGTNESTPLAKDYVSALLLGAKGYLVDWSGESLPALREPPQRIDVYGGFIEYGQIRAPMQLRLAIDSTGALVNSWAEISVERPVATPMTGQAICSTPEKCEIKGDGKGFAQAWAINSDPNNPTFDPKLPFSGMRWFDLSFGPKAVNGRFYDPMVILNRKKEGMSFELANTAHVRF